MALQVRLYGNKEQIEGFVQEVKEDWLESGFVEGPWIPDLLGKNRFFKYLYLGED